MRSFIFLGMLLLALSGGLAACGVKITPIGDLSAEDAQRFPAVGGGSGGGGRS